MNKIKLHLSYRRIAASRIFVTALFILIQILWMAVSVMKVISASVYINMGLRVLSLAVVIGMVSRDDNPSYKMTWILVILAVPVFGVLLYLSVGRRRPSKRLRRRLDEAAAKCPPLTEGLLQPDRSSVPPRYSAVMDYVTKYSGSPVCGDTEVKYYPMGEDMLPDMLAELEKAKHTIFIEYFIISEGYMWNSIAAVLARKAEAGVRIRIIYDDMGCAPFLPPNYQRILESIHPNIRCRAFNPIVPFFSAVMNHRDHRKLMIIDNSVCFTGGLNLSDEYINRTHPYGVWKDTGVMLRGSGALSFTQMFMGMWLSFGDDDELSADTLPIPQYDTPSDCLVQPFCDSPLDGEELSRNIYIGLLNAAEKSAYIFTPYLIPDDALKNALILAAKRGVDIRIVTPGIPDKKAVYRLTRANYAPLMDAGVRIYEYTPGFIHAKSMICDGQAAMVGTVNLDFRSLFLHFEDGVLICGRDAVAPILKDCLDTFEKSREVTSEYLANNCRLTMFDYILRLFSPLI